MPKISPLDRLFLLVTGLLAAYQIAIGIEGLGTLAITAYTISFGVLLVASLLLIILGFEALESSIVVILATILPLGLSIGLIAQYFPRWQLAYLGLAGTGFVLIALTRTFSPRYLSSIVLAVVHGIAGLIIFTLPLLLSLTGRTPTGFSLVAVGGGLISLGGLLLSFWKVGRPIIPGEKVIRLLPGLLLATTVAFVTGFLLSAN